MAKTVFITGGNRGIGLTIKDLFLAKGFKVLAPTRAELNLSERPSVEKFLATCDERVDILINNAAENPIKKIAEIDLKTWDYILQTNITSPFMLVQHFAPKMAERKFGRIINISSVYSAQARPGRCMYSCTKSALDALTRTTAVEFSAQGVLVNSVCPGFIDTELTRKNNSEAVIQELLKRVPVGKLGKTSDVANFVYFLASEENGFITGQSLHLDGAFSIA